MSNLKMFKFESHFVRIEMKDSTPWFCLKDVCDILQILNRSKLRSRMKSEGITKSYISKNNRNYSLLFVNESNLYRVIFQSNKPEAERFQDWVFEEVLPQIRKTGSYGQQQLALTLDKITHYPEIYESIERIAACFTHSDDSAPYHIFRHIHRLLGTPNSGYEKNLGAITTQHHSYLITWLKDLENHTLSMIEKCKNIETEVIARFINPSELLSYVNTDYLPMWLRTTYKTPAKACQVVNNAFMG
jgi:hypothetical protein